MVLACFVPFTLGDTVFVPSARLFQIEFTVCVLRTFKIFRMIWCAME